MVPRPGERSPLPLHVFWHPSTEHTRNRFSHLAVDRAATGLEQTNWATRTATRDTENPCPNRFCKFPKAGEQSKSNVVIMFVGAPVCVHLWLARPVWRPVCAGNLVSGFALFLGLSYLFSSFSSSSASKFVLWISSFRVALFVFLSFPSCGFPSEKT